jgi:hypothetical protein
MRLRTAVAVISFAPLLASPVAAQSSPAEREVLAALETFTEGLRRKDADMMRSVVEPYTRLTLLRPAQGGGGQVVVFTVDDFLSRVTAPQQPALDEPIRNPVFQMDGDLATVWAEYQVRIDGRVSHCGYDAFHLVRLGGRWKILNVSDTLRQEGCGEPWS